MAFKRASDVTPVAERLQWLEGKQVQLRVSYTDVGREETLTAVYQETVAVGREYFFVFVVDERKRRLIRTISVVEMVEL